MAVAAWRAARLPDDLLHCAGGVELTEVGFVADVEIAAQHDVSEVVPLLVDESFRDARRAATGGAAAAPRRPLRRRKPTDRSGDGPRLSLL